MENENNNAIWKEIKRKGQQKTINAENWMRYMQMQLKRTVNESTGDKILFYGFKYVSSSATSKQMQLREEKMEMNRWNNTHNNW